jgi:type IV pilus assembly protein PilX
MRTHANESHRSLSPHRRSKGISLIYSLLALAAISLAAVALVRSVNGGGLVIGNLAFKQDASLSSARAAETAVSWLSANAAALTLDSSLAGYYATSRDTLDITGTSRPADSARSVVDWDDNNCSSYTSGSYAVCVDANPALLNVGNGNTARYIILRQCAQEGDPMTSNVDCLAPVAVNLDNTTNKGGLNYSQQGLATNLARAQYYRVVVRTRGARNTVAFTETVIQL